MSGTLMSIDVAAPRPTFAQMAALAEELARLYEDPDDSRRLVTDAGLEALRSRVDFRTAPLVRWSQIVDWAAGLDGRATTLRTLIEAALGDRPDPNAQLMAAAKPFLDMLTPSATPSAPTAVVDVAPPRPRIHAEPELPLVDRADAVDLLERSITATATTSAGGAVLLVGESGIGKTRLAQRAMRLAGERGMVILEARCVGQRAEALHPIRQSIATYRHDRSVRQLLHEGGEQLERYVPFVESFLELGNGGRASRPIGGSRPSGLYLGLVHVLLGLAGRSGLLLVVEDLTDADRDTLSFLEALYEVAANGRVLTISTVKKDLVEKPLQALITKWARLGSQVYEVSPLSRDETAEYIALLATDVAEDATRVDEIHALTNGNPFFIQQIVTYAREQEGPERPAELPRDLAAVLEARLNLLDDETLAFIDAASVALENTQRLDLVALLANVKPRTALVRLRKAVDRQCLREDEAGGVWFVQELLRRAVYAKLGPNARTQLHRLAAKRLEEDGLLASAAHHYARAGDRDDAVRTALEAASRAEYAGSYETAVELYRLAMTPGDVSIGIRLARAYIVLADRDQAAAVLAELDADAPDVRYLQAQLAFYDGRMERAAEETERVLPLLGSGRLDARIWLAGIYLYLGRLDTARTHAETALEETDDPTMIARCKGIVGASALYGGDIEGSERIFLEAATDLSKVPIEQRDRFAYTTLLGNVGQAREAHGNWAGARRSFQELLDSRRAVSDARGVMHALHAVARTEIGLLAFDAARPMLEEARQLATRLGDSLELAKLDHTDGHVALATGDDKEAVRLVGAALDRFRELRVAYDVAHARFSLAAAFAASERPRRAIEEGALARTEAQKMGFGLLARLFPALGSSYVDRIAAAILSNQRDDVLVGVAGLLLRARGEDLRREAESQLRAVSGGTIVSIGSPVGWAWGIAKADERRGLVQTLGDASGLDGEGICAASIVAACASWALEGALPALLLDVAVEEATSVTEATGADRRITGTLSSIALGQWRPDRSSNDLDAYEILARALWCVATERGPEQALEATIGGGGMTVGALVGTFVGPGLPPEDARARAPTAFGDPDPAEVDRLARGLAAIRIGRGDG